MAMNFLQKCLDATRPGSGQHIEQTHPAAVRGFVFGYDAAAIPMPQPTRSDNHSGLGIFP
jgi:hypothetical protein